MKGLVAKVYFSVLSDRKSRRYFFMDFCMEIYLLMQDAIALPIFLDLMLKAYDDGRKDVMYKYLVIWIFMGVLFLFLRYWFDLFVNGKFYYLTVDNIRETCLKNIYKFRTQNIDQNYNGNELYVFLDQDLTRLINSLFRFNRILADAIIIVCFLIWSLSVGGWLAVIVVIGATIGPFIATKESKKIDKYNEEVYQKKSIYAGGLRGLFSGTEAYLGKGIYRESSVKCISDIGEFIQSTLTLSKQRAHKINMVSAVDGLVYLSLVVLSYFFIDIENSSSIIVLISVYSTMKTYISGLGGNISYIFENQYVAKKYEEISSTQIVKDERTTTTNIFEMKNVSYKVDNHDILQNIDFVMKTNSKVALIGKNGSGKTTLLKILLSLIVPSEGSVVISDKEKYGYVPVHSQLFPVSIEENIDYGNENEKFDKMDQLVESVELSCLGKDRLTEELHDGEENLSGGEAQRVSIARALAAESSVLVLDEPTANLDVLTSHKVFDTLVHSVTNILFTTHNPELLQYADQIYILDKGRIVTSGTYDEIRKSIIYREWKCEVQGK